MFKASRSENPSSSGGRAAASGIGYQARVGAYYCVKILAESEAAPLWGLNHQEILEAIAFETNNQVDDLLIRTSHGRRVFVNVKRRLVNSASEGSDFAKAIDQMVRQFLETPETDRANNRLVLVTSTDSSKAISTHLHNLLARIRNSAASQPLAELVTFLTGQGDRCADQLISHFDAQTDDTALTVTDMDVPTDEIDESAAHKAMTWNNHRWVRLRSMFASFEKMIKDTLTACDVPENGDPGYEDLLHHLKTNRKEMRSYVASDGQIEAALDTIVAMRELKKLWTTLGGSRKVPEATAAASSTTADLRVLKKEAHAHGFNRRGVSD